MNKLRFIVKSIITFLRKPLFALYHSSVDSTSWVKGVSNTRYSKIGKWCFVNKLVGLNHVEIGNYCSIAANVLIGGMEHGTEHCSTSTKLSDATYADRTTIIGHDVWIGSYCVIRQGVRIGDGAIIGAMSFVNRDVPPYSIVFGIPAKVARIRLPEIVINELNESRYWEKPPKEARKILSEIENKYLTKE